MAAPAIMTPTGPPASSTVTSSMIIRRLRTTNHTARNHAAYSAPGRTRRGRLAAVRCARPDSIQRSTVASGAVVVPARRDLDPDYWISALTLSDEEGQG